MKPATFLPALAVLALSGCVTGYGYSDDGYYLRLAFRQRRFHGSIGMARRAVGYGYGLGYGAPG